MKPNFITVYTDTHDQYVVLGCPTGENIQNVIEFVISEISELKSLKVLLPIDGCYFAYGSSVVALTYKPEGISWKII